MSRFIKSGKSFENLLSICSDRGVSFTLDYSEGEDVMSIDVRSAAEAEEYAEKRVYDIEDFIGNLLRYWGKK